MYRKTKAPSPQEYIASVNRRLEELKSNDWCKRVLSRIKTILSEHDVQSVRCLAIGSPSEYQNSQYQLAFLYLIAKTLEISTVSVWDPDFREIDTAVFMHWDFKVQEDMQHSAHTLYYVPHGPLRVNAALARSDSLLYLGNGFKNFIPRMDIDKETLDALKILGNQEVASFPLTHHEKIYQSMNNLALCII